MLALAYSYQKGVKELPGLISLLTDESLSTVHLPSHNMHCKGIWDLTQVYLEQKLVLLLHHPS
jgi:hypothetical protein